MKQKCELEHWDNVKRACKYPIEDNNEGYIYGIYLLDNDYPDYYEVLEVEWFKTDKERFKAIKKYNLEIVN